MNTFLLLFILIIIIILYKNYKEYLYDIENLTQVNFVPRQLIGNATCIKDDIGIDSSPFMCQMNKKYSPVNASVITIKYENFAPYLTNSPSSSFSLLNTLTPSLTSPPLISNNDFDLIGTTTNQITEVKSLNDYKKLMKVTSYNPGMLYDKLGDPKIEISSLEDNKFLYLPDCVVSYIKYLRDLNLLQSFIDVNKISSLDEIANQFQLYLKGLLLPYKVPNTPYRLQREIVIIFTSDKKNIVNIQFNQKINDKSNTYNINTKYDYFIINSFVDAKQSNQDIITPIKQMIKIYGNALKSRQLIDDYDINQLLDKINNNLLYVNYYVNNQISKKSDDNEPIMGIQLVKRVNGNFIFMNYFNSTFTYYKNICPDPTNNFFYKGRCYSNCPKNYTNIGLSCSLDKEKNSNEINKLFNPDSNFCKQICSTSNTNVGNYDTVLQQACWCQTVSCNKCGEFSIGKCNC